MNQSPVNKIAFVDVDGTLFRGQIQYQLLKFFYKKRLISWFYYLKLSIWFLMYKFSLTNSDINDIFNYGLKYLIGKEKGYLDSLIEEFLKSYINDYEYPKSNKLIKSLKEQGFYVVILSTAIDLVIERIAFYYEVDDYISTKLEKIDGIYTGRINGGLIYGDSKLEAVKVYCSNHNVHLGDCVAYADHLSDFMMLKAVGKGYVVNPNKKLVLSAKIEGLNLAFTY